MGCLPRSALFLVTESRSLTRSPNSFVLGESWEIRDYHGWYVPSEIVFQTVTIHLKVGTIELSQLNGTIREHLCYGEWSRPTSFKLTRENLQTRVKKKHLITNVENAVFDLGIMTSFCFLFIN